MIRTSASLEAALCTAYRSQAACYRQVVALAESLPALLRAGGEAHAECLGRVMTLLGDVARIEEQTRADREQWLLAGGRPGADLKAVLDEVMHSIQQVARGLAAAEEEAARQQDRLLPQVHTMTQGRAMHGPTASRDRRPLEADVLGRGFGRVGR